MNELASSAVEALSPYLPAIGQVAYRAGQNVAARTLHGLISTAFREIGAESVWDRFTDDPRDPSTVEKMLASALTSNPRLAEDIDKAVETLNHDQSSRITNQIGNTLGKGATNVGGDYTRGSHNTTNNHKKSGAFVAVVVVVVLAFVIVVLVAYTKSKGDSLSADSTCSDFLQAPQDEELTALRKIGADAGVAGIGSPLALPAVSYSCSGSPDAKLGDVIVKFKGQF